MLPLAHGQRRLSCLPFCFFTSFQFKDAVLCLPLSLSIPCPATYLTGSHVCFVLCLPVSSCSCFSALSFQSFVVYSDSSVLAGNLRCHCLLVSNACSIGLFGAIWLLETCQPEVGGLAHKAWHTQALMWSCTCQACALHVPALFCCHMQHKHY